MKVQRPRALWEDTSTFGHVLAALPVSVGLHLALALVLVLQSFFSGPKKLPPPSYEVMLIGPIKKGKPGGGAPAPASNPASASKPDITKPASPATPAKPDELVIPVSTPKNAKPGATPIPDPAAARAEALARLQRERALQNAKELAARSAASGNSPIPSAGAPQTSPTSTGGSGAGEGDGGSEYGVEWSSLSGSASYEQQIQAIVIANWLPPIASEKKTIQCIIRVVIGFDGKITSTKVEESSGDAAFDASALASLRKSDPFPPPPIDLKPYLAKKGVPLRFDSRTKKLAGGGAP